MRNSGIEFHIFYLALRVFHTNKTIHQFYLIHIILNFSGKIIFLSKNGRKLQKKKSSRIMVISLTKYKYPVLHVHVYV